IKKAQRKGHKVFVCTGRARSQVGASIKDIGFDGYIYSAGTVVEVGKQLVHSDQLDEQMVWEIVEILEERGLGYILEGYENSYYDERAAGYFTSLHNNVDATEESITFLNELSIKPMSEFKMGVMINKLCFFAYNNEEIMAVKAIYGSKVDFMIHEYDGSTMIAAELTLPGINKASGMDVVLAYCAASLEQTIGLGDSRNDMEMIAHAHLGISMGNGIEALKEIANDVTDTLENDGVYKAFEKHGLF
ncbi:MAG: HAD family phosphatase, partial [Vallitaleaceae bacterium]|nr:HAD family phosphatase [Vallitaleaceae bacterium]